MTHPLLPASVIEPVARRRGRRHAYETIDPRRTALVVIDLQRAFMEPGLPAEVPAARAIVPNVNRIAQALREAGGTVVFVRATFEREGWPLWFGSMLTPELAGRMLATLQEGAPEHELWPALEVMPEDLIVAKYRFSAFLPGASALPAMLRGRGIDTVLIAGCMTNMCCDSSARDAVMTDFRTVMVEDANAARTDAIHLAALANFLQSFGDVRSVDDLIAALGP